VNDITHLGFLNSPATPTYSLFKREVTNSVTGITGTASKIYDH